MNLKMLYKHTNELVNFANIITQSSAKTTNPQLEPDLVLFVSISL